MLHESFLRPAGVWAQVQWSHSRRALFGGASLLPWWVRVTRAWWEYVRVLRVLVAVLFLGIRRAVGHTVVGRGIRKVQEEERRLGSRRKELAAGADSQGRLLWQVGGGAGPEAASWGSQGWARQQRTGGVEAGRAGRTGGSIRLEEGSRTCCCCVDGWNERSE